MAKRILIDSSHPEETRVVVLSGNRVEDFDFETSSRKQLKGNIYLAKITRVEPSLQAAFVDYGGNRHGFLPFSEIHPDYYRIPIADREALLAEEAALRSEVADEAPDDVEIEDPTEEELQAEDRSPDGGEAQTGEDSEAETEGTEAVSGDGQADVEAADVSAPAARGETPAAGAGWLSTADGAEETAAESPDETGESNNSDLETEVAKDAANAESDDGGTEDAENGDAENGDVENGDGEHEEVVAEQKVDTVGGDEAEEAALRRAKLLRRYKIQEVIKRRQVILVQVTKEERGNKGAALTTYLSLPGRYCVLMPNTNKGGGISRKISNTGDRRRLKQILSDLEIPEGIAVIVRTAGSQRTKVEIRRDYEYLLRLWDSIREATLQSTAPALIYEEANLIKRTIRDLYSRDMDEVLVDGDEGYKAAKDFMKSLTPSHAKKVQQYKDREVPLFQSFQVESQLDAMHSNTVQLRSGGYLVLNQTEALVAIDVNSGRATRERHIEETALKTNLEAAEEIGRQLRLRDLAGLIVIDFIDMEESRRNREVERRLKDSLRSDRARIQLGRISPFGLLEMSRQRMRPSIFESSTEICPHCGGSGRVRTVESLALQVLRRLEEEGLRESDATIVVTVPTKVALYILNRKRDHLIAIEQRYDFRVSIETDDHLATDAFVIERDGVVAERRRTAQDEGRAGEGEEGERKRGRRRGRRRRKDEDQSAAAEENIEVAESEGEAEDEEPEGRGIAAEEQDDERQRKRKRRGKRGGRRRSRRRSEEGESEGAAPDGSDGLETQAEDSDLPQSDGETAEAETAEGSDGSATEEPSSEAVEGEAPEPAAASRGRSQRRRSPRQRRGTRKSAGDAVSATADETPEAESSDAEKPKRAPRRRGPSRGRGSGRQATKSEPQEVAAAEAGSFGVDTAAPEPAAEESNVPAGGPSPETMVADDPKVVIEPATPAAAAAEQAEAGTIEPAVKEEDEHDQPKRRGWWNRFI